MDRFLQNYLHSLFGDNFCRVIKLHDVNICNLRPP
jgi:hypothetical protein